MRLTLTGINFTTETHHRLSDPGANDGAVLSLVVDDMILALFDIVARGLSPCLRKGCQRFELVALRSSW